MHGLFRSENLELGRDEDPGGQIIHVRYLAQELAALPEVDQVDVMVRRIVIIGVRVKFPRPHTSVCSSGLA